MTTIFSSVIDYVKMIFTRNENPSRPSILPQPSPPSLSTLSPSHSILPLLPSLSSSLPSSSPSFLRFVAAHRRPSLFFTRPIVPMHTHPFFQVKPTLPFYPCLSDMTKNQTSFPREALSTTGLLATTRLTIPLLFNHTLFRETKSEETQTDEIVLN